MADLEKPLDIYGMDAETPGADEQRPEVRRDPVVLAIERVLEAERAAEARLQHCRKQAEARVAAAREQAAAVTRRADTRISRLHAAYLTKIADDIAKLPIPQATACESIDDADLEKATNRLAAKLTGDA
jgi:hypothetical protein